MIATEDVFIDTFQFNLAVGFKNYLVYDPDPLPGSGQIINSILTSLGYIGSYTTNLLSEPTLAVYRSMFICCGVYPNNYRFSANGSVANAIINYLNNGGRVYLEGGDVWYSDPLVGGQNFCALFGIQAFNDGYGDMGPVVGQSGRFTQGMYFNYVGENNSMDHINPITGFLIFADGNSGYYCGVAYNSGTYRTIGTSFELGSLVDATAPSTKAILLDSIMHFLNLPLSGVEENNQSIIANKQLRLYPNPVKFGDGVRIQFAPKTNTQISLKIYNAVGNCIKTILVDDNSHSIIWNGTDENGLNVPAGVYFVNVNLDNKTLIERVVLIN